MKWLQRLRPSSVMMRKLGMIAVLVGVAIGGFCWGRRGSSFADANPPFGRQNGSPATISAVAATPGATTEDYQKRVVAYIYDNIPVTREELGEYLIARFGADRLDFLVNRKLVEMACAQQGFTVTDAEIDTQLREDLRAFGHITQEQFVTHILKRFNKSLYEWREDVIRPKLMITKLVRSSVQVTEQDTLNAFEAKYGPKVECRMIVTPNDKKKAQKIWEEASKSRDTFLTQAKNQDIKPLAAEEGKVPPVHKFFGDPRIEEVAFRLKEGEIGPLIELPDGTSVILLCERHLPKDISKRYEDERAKLYNEVFEFKLAEKIPQTFNEIRQRANPRLLLASSNPNNTAYRPTMPRTTPTTNMPVPPPPTSPDLIQAGHTTTVPPPPQSPQSGIGLVPRPNGSILQGN